MKFLTYFSVITLWLGVSHQAVSAPTEVKKPNISSQFSPLTSDLSQNGTLFDSKSPQLIKIAKKKKKGRKLRKKHLTGERRVKGGSTKIDFGDTSIDGRRRTPAGVAISKSKEDHAYDLIKLRFSWHPEMKASTSNIQSGR